MNKNEFINALRKRLKYMPKEDLEDAVAYYTELIDDMELTEDEDVTQKLGQPQDIARDILGECAKKAADNQAENKSVKSSTKTVWLTLLLIASLPVSLPLAFAAIVVIFVILVVIIALFIAFIAVVLSGIIALIGSIFIGGLGNKLVSLGTSLLLIGIGIFGFNGIKALFNIFSKILSKKLIKKSNLDNNELNKEVY